MPQLINRALFCKEIRMISHKKALQQRYYIACILAAQCQSILPSIIRPLSEILCNIGATLMAPSDRSFKYLSSSKLGKTFAIT